MANNDVLAVGLISKISFLFKKKSVKPVIDQDAKDIIFYESVNEKL